MRSPARLATLFTYGTLSAAFAMGEGVGMSLVQLRASPLSNVSRPHIVFVLADDLGWNGVGFTGGAKKQVKTPFIDELARDGVILDAYYVGPYCAPSRFALLTGRSPWKSEAGYMNFREDTPIGTNLGYTMLPAALKQVGYETHLIGKWHQGFHMESYLPTSRGFDAAYGIVTGCTDHFTQRVFLNGNAPCTANGHGLTDMLDNGSPAIGYKPGEFSDDVYRHMAVNLIKTHDKNKPLFLYLALQLPHEPFQATDEYASKYSLSKEENTFWGMHSHVDDTVKAVVHALGDKGMYWNTILVFTSDNGAEHSRYVEPFNANFPLRGHKGLLWDGGIHVPCFVNGGALPDWARGRKLGGLMGVEDWYATFAHITGAALDSGGPTPHDSKDNWKYIIGESAESSRKEVVQNHFGLTENNEGLRFSIARIGKHKAVAFGKATAVNCNGCRDCTPTYPCVYNLEADPGETIDIADTIDNDMFKYFIQRMQESWSEAYAQPFFGVDRPSNDEPSFERACSQFSAHGGYLTPWATQDDEMRFAQREFSIKPAMVEGITAFEIPRYYSASFAANYSA